MLVLNTALSSLLYLVLPIYFLFADPGWLMRMALVSLALDTALVILAARVYRRHDVWWSLASRIPTRLVGRYAYVLAMTRVLLNRPGKAWDKLERRGTAGFLASSHARSDGA